MDIVTLQSSNTKRRHRKSSARRHTTEVYLEQLSPPSLLDSAERSLSSENLSSSSQENDEPPSASTDRNSFSSSWSSFLGGSGDLERGSEVSDLHFLESDSQSDLFQELSELEGPHRPHLDNASRHQYQLSYELALDNMLTPFASHTTPTISPLTTTKPVSHIGRVLQELVSTEKSYVHDLSDIIDGYVQPLEGRLGTLPLQSSHLDSVFGNIREIRDFHTSLLGSLMACGRDPTKVGACFVEKAEEFKIYTQYCNNYPNSVKTLVELSRDSEISRFLKICQRRLNHMLPLGAYLLKPVQRVLKYSLLLDEMVKHLKEDSDGHHYLTSALANMTEVAEHINAMKKKYDAAVHVQEIQNLIRGWEGLDLAKYGDLVLEESFRYSGGKSASTTFRRSERYVFLFQRLCLVTKREEDLYLYKTHLEMKDLQLTEKMEKDVTSFQIRQVSSGRAYTFQARNMLTKERWVRTIKLLLMESIPHLPDKAKLLILSGFPTTAPSEPSSKRSPRQRHFSEEPQSPSRKLRSSTSSVSTSGNHSKTLSLLNDRESRRRRTPPTMMHSTRSLVQASFAALHSPPRVESPLSEEEGSSTPPPPPLPSGLQTSTPQRDSDYSETSRVTSESDVRQQPQATLGAQPGREGAESVSPVPSSKDPVRQSPRLLYSRLRSRSRSSTPELEEGRSKRHASPLLNTSSNKAIIVKATEHPITNSGDPESSDVQENDFDVDTTITAGSAVEGDESGELTRINSVEEREVEKVEQTQNGDIIRPPSMFSDEESPTISTQNTHTEHRYKFTDDDETLFNDLMHTKAEELEYAANGYRNSSFNQREAVLLQQTLNEMQDQNGESENDVPYLHVLPPEEFAGPPVLNDVCYGEDTALTPRASPFTSPSPSRHCAVNGLDSMEDATPLSTPNLHRKETLTAANAPPLIPNYDSFAPPPVLRTPSASTTSVVRRHSFTSNTQHSVVHKREQSLSTDNSPKSSPIPKFRKKASKEKQKSSSLKRHSSFSSQGANISLLGLISSTRNDLEDLPSVQAEHVDDLGPTPSRHSLILPPPDEFGVHDEYLPDMYSAIERPESFPESNVAGASVSHDGTSGDSRESSPQVEHQRAEGKPTKPLSWFQRQRKTSKSSTSSPNINASVEREPSMDIVPRVPSEALLPVTVVAPYEGNPEESLSFDEILQSFGEYASATGKTAKYTDVPPQQKQGKSKKKGRRNMTVAAIDADTMMQVKEEIARNERKRTNSKVQQLARDYSRKIKDQNSKAKLRKRFSTVVEEPHHSSETPPGREPSWLQSLREQRRSRPVTGEEELDPSDYCDTGPQSDSDSHRLGASMDGGKNLRTRPKASTIPRTSSEEGIYLLHRGNDSDTKKGGFKGFVKNIVAKFSKDKN